MERRTGGSGAFTTLCSSTTSPTCIAGSNNFAGPNEALSVSFDELRLTFIKGNEFGICEIWAYAFKNYAPLSTFSFVWDTSVMEPKSYAVNYATSPFSFMSSGIMIGISSSSPYYTSEPHTCTWIENSADNSAVVVTLPYYLEI